MRKAQDRRRKSVGPKIPIVLKHPDVYQRLGKAADCRPRQAGAFGYLTVSQQVGASPERAKNFDAPLQGPIQCGFFEVLASR